jgi:hypothetical protein
MNIIRAKIIAFWLLFLLFCLMLCFSWRYRILWLCIFLLVGGMMGLFKPRPQRPSLKLVLLFGFGFILFLLSVFLHGFVYPSSAGFLLLAKIASVLFVVPVLCYTACVHYRAFRASQNAGAEGGAANGSQPIRSETNRSSSAAGSRR